MSKALKAIIDKHYTAAQKLDEFQVEDVRSEEHTSELQSPR